MTDRYRCGPKNLKSQTDMDMDNDWQDEWPIDIGVTPNSNSNWHGQWSIDIGYGPENSNSY